MGPFDNDPHAVARANPGPFPWKWLIGGGIVAGGLWYFTRPAEASVAPPEVPGPTPTTTLPPVQGPPPRLPTPAPAPTHAPPTTHAPAPPVRPPARPPARPVAPPTARPPVAPPTARPPVVPPPPVAPVPLPAPPSPPSDVRCTDAILCRVQTVRAFQLTANRDGSGGTTGVSGNPVVQVLDRGPSDTPGVSWTLARIQSPNSHAGLVGWMGIENTRFDRVGLSRFLMDTARDNPGIPWWGLALGLGDAAGLVWCVTRPEAVASPLPPAQPPIVLAVQMPGTARL